MENFAQRVEKNNDTMLEEMQQENSKMVNELELKVKRMQCCLDFLPENINPLLDLVSRFRFEIIKELKIDKIIPSEFNDWNYIWNHLRCQGKLQAIDETAEKEIGTILNIEIIVIEQNQ
jgi:hypothetical protein